MRCRGRFLLLALLLLPAGLGNGAATLPPNASLLPTPSEGIPVGRDAPSEGIPVGRDTTLGSTASATVSVTQPSSGAAGWEGGSTVPTTAGTGIGPSSVSSTGWELSSSGSTPGSQPAGPSATLMGDVVQEPATAPLAPGTPLSQTGALAPSPATMSSSAAPRPGSSRPRVSPPASSVSQGMPTSTEATPAPPLPDVTTSADKTGPATGIAVQEVPRALSAGSIVAITLIVIVIVVLVFGTAAYLKIRHSSYGRLLDNHDYGSWGSYNNPLYDDS